MRTLSYVVYSEYLHLLDYYLPVSSLGASLQKQASSVPTAALALLAGLQKDFDRECIFEAQLPLWSHPSPFKKKEDEGNLDFIYITIFRQGSRCFFLFF